LIFTREAPVGECGIIQDARGLFLGQRTMVYRVNPEMFDNLFLLWSVQSEFWKSQVDDLSGGSTTPHLRVPDCSKILVKVPPLAEQKVISNAINSVESFLHQRQQKLAEIEQIKKALMQDLLTGKVRVKVDEPEKESAVA
jgi:type I restriction enzyme S subunit